MLFSSRQSLVISCCLESLLLLTLANITSLLAQLPVVAFRYRLSLTHTRIHVHWSRERRRAHATQRNHPPPALSIDTALVNTPTLSNRLQTPPLLARPCNSRVAPRQHPHPACSSTSLHPIVSAATPSVLNLGQSPRPQSITATPLYITHSCRVSPTLLLLYLIIEPSYAYPSGSRLCTNCTGF